MDKYELFKDIGTGNFGVARLMRNKETKELVAMKYIERGQICHRDLKLENTLLDGSPAPRLKTCDFGHSKSSLLHSRPKSTVGTPADIAPEVLWRREYDGKLADVWSCGVTLHVMLVGAYPFEDQQTQRISERPLIGYLLFNTSFQTMFTFLKIADISFLVYLSQIRQGPLAFSSRSSERPVASLNIEAVCIFLFRESASEKSRAIHGFYRTYPEN